MVGTQYIFLVECWCCCRCCWCVFCFSISTIHSLEKRIHAQAVENKCATVHSVKSFPLTAFRAQGFLSWMKITNGIPRATLVTALTLNLVVETNSTAIVLLLQIHFQHNVNISIFDQLHQWHAGSDAINHLWFDFSQHRDNAFGERMVDLFV